MRIRFLAPKRWRFLVGPCGEGFARSSEGALSSTGSAWVCCVVYTNSVPFQAHHAKKNIWKSPSGVTKVRAKFWKMVFNRMDIDSDSDNDIYNDNTPCLWWFASLGKQLQKWQPACFSFSQSSVFFLSATTSPSEANWSPKPNDWSEHHEILQ